MLTTIQELERPSPEEEANKLLSWVEISRLEVMRHKTGVTREITTQLQQENL